MNGMHGLNNDSHTSDPVATSDCDNQQHVNSDIRTQTQVQASPAKPILRSWILTANGLVEITQNSGAAMGGFLDKPVTEKKTEKGEGNGLRFAYADMQGWRIDMEDAHVMQLSLGPAPFSLWSLFAVFDGHAGSQAAADAAQLIAQHVLETDQFKQLSTSLLSSEGAELSEESARLVEEGLKTAFLQLDETIRQRLGTDKSGCTAVAALVTPSHFVIANLGDSRAILARRGEAVMGTEDHKPYNKRERDRVVAAGGQVMIQRINGSLAVSRALGDFEYKAVCSLPATAQMVSPEPDIYVIERNKEIDEFLVVACDGIYDVMENRDVAEFIRARMAVSGCVETVAKELLDACLYKGSKDNMTVVIVAGEAAPQKDPVLAEKEAEWLAKTEKMVDDIVTRETSSTSWTAGDEMSVDWVLRTLAEHRQEKEKEQGEGEKKSEGETAAPAAAAAEEEYRGMQFLVKAIVEKTLTHKGIAHAN